MEEEDDPDTPPNACVGVKQAEAAAKSIDLGHQQQQLPTTKETGDTMVLLSSHKLCRFVTYTMFVRIRVAARERTGLSRCAFTRACLGARCCKVGTLEEAGCTLCGKPVVTLSAEGDTPVVLPPDGEVEQYTFSVKSRCTSSRDHLHAQVFLVITVGNLTLSSQPVSLQARLKRKPVTPKIDVPRKKRALTWTNFFPPGGDQATSQVLPLEPPTGVHQVATVTKLNASPPTPQLPPTTKASIMLLSFPLNVFNQLWSHASSIISNVSGLVRAEAKYISTASSTGVCFFFLACCTVEDTLKLRQLLLNYASDPRLNLIGKNLLQCGAASILAEVTSW